MPSIGRASSWPDFTLYKKGGAEISDILGGGGSILAPYLFGTCEGPIIHRPTKWSFGVFGPVRAQALRREIS